MSWEGWLQAAALVLAVLVTTRLLGPYLARVLSPEPAREDRVFLPVERLIYRVLGVDPSGEQRWTIYALSLLAFSAVSVLGLFALQRVQGALFLNPTDAAAVPPALAFNTAASFVTNTNWQNYGGESTMSHLTQMSGLAVQNFVSAAVGIAVAVALIRGLTRRRSETIGNFWVDLTRVTVRVLLPLSIVVAVVLVSQGVVQNLTGFTTHRPLGRVMIPRRADREVGAIKGWARTAEARGANRRAAENPRASRASSRWALLAIPSPLPRLQETRSRPAVGVLRNHIRALGSSAALAASAARQRCSRIGASTASSTRQGSAVSAGGVGLFAASTTDTSTGTVARATAALGGAAPAPT